MAKKVAYWRKSTSSHRGPPELVPLAVGNTELNKTGSLAWGSSQVIWGDYLQKIQSETIYGPKVSQAKPARTTSEEGDVSDGDPGCAWECNNTVKSVHTYDVSSSLLLSSISCPAHISQVPKSCPHNFFWGHAPSRHPNIFHLSEYKLSDLWIISLQNRTYYSDYHLP